jgi:hypothetical protein
MTTIQTVPFFFTTYGSLSPSVSNNSKQLLGEAERERRH